MIWWAKASIVYKKNVFLESDFQVQDTESLNYHRMFPSQLNKELALGSETWILLLTSAFTSYVTWTPSETQLSHLWNGSNSTSLMKLLKEHKQTA